jgi:hypothetical protein
MALSKEEKKLHLQLAHGLIRPIEGGIPTPFKLVNNRRIYIGINDYMRFWLPPTWQELMTAEVKPAWALIHYNLPYPDTPINAEELQYARLLEQDLQERRAL